MTAPRGGWRPGDAARRGRLMPRLVIVLLMAAGAALAGPAPAAQAHAFLAASNPTDGQVLAASPTQLRLDFSEAVVLGATRIDIVDATGRHITPTGLKLVSHGAAADIEQPVEVVADLPTLGRSSYRISWETLSSDDLHSTSGVLVFGVGEPVTAGGLDEPSPSPVEAGLRWLILVGLAGSLGGTLAIRLLERAGGPDADRAAQLARMVRARAAITGAGVAVVLLVNQLALSRGGVAALLWSSYGLRWGLRESGLVLLVVSATARARSLASMTSRLLLAVGAALACGGTALLGHSGAGAAPNITRVIASAAHVGAAATWAGGVAILTLVLVPHLRTRAPSRGLAGTVLKGFGPPAAVCVGVMVVTGVYLSSKVIGSVDAALFTIYGRTMLAKVMLACVAGSLALVSTLRLHHRDERVTPRRSVVAEAVAAVGVLALAGVLTSAQPAIEPQLVQATTAASTVVDGAVADLQETVSISPNRPGASVVLVDVFETRRPSPGPVREVLVSLLGASGRSEPQRAEQLSHGRWSLATRLPDPGSIQVHVLVRRSGLPDATRSFAWTVGAGQVHTNAAVVSTAPVGAFLERVAAVLLGLMLTAWVLTLLVLTPWLRRRRGGVPPGGQSPLAQLDDELRAAGEHPSEQIAQPVGAMARSLK